MDEAQIKQRMQHVLGLVKQDIGTIRTGRATPHLVESIYVEAYGGASHLTVRELASITTPDPHTIVITPWDKTIVGEIRKGIESANIGLNPVINGELIRISLPPLTSEDREKYVKLLHQKLEHARVAIRQIRQEGMHDIKNAQISEDEIVRQEKELQKITDEFIEQIDQIGKAKEIELRTL